MVYFICKGFYTNMQLVESQVLSGDMVQLHPCHVTTLCLHHQVPVLQRSYMPSKDNERMWTKWWTIDTLFRINEDLWIVYDWTCF